MVQKVFSLARTREAFRSLRPAALAPRFSELRDLRGMLQQVVGPRVQRLTYRTLELISARLPIVAALLGKAKIRGLWESEAPSAPAATSQAPGAFAWGSLDSPQHELARSSDFRVRARAASTLALTPGEDVTATLIAALRDPVVEVAVACVQALGQRTDDSSRRALQEVASSRDHWFHPATRAAAVATVASSQGGLGLELVVRALHDESAEVSIVAIATLGRLFPQRAQEHLVPVLTDQNGFFLPEVRLTAARSLERAQALTPAQAQQLAGGERDPQVLAVLDRITRARPN